MKRILFLKLTFVFVFLSNGLSWAQIKVACIGNSITYGSGIENREKYNYPAQLQTILGKTWEVKNFGVSGRTMLKKGNQPLWKEPAFKEALAYQPDVVIIKLGTNDSKDVNWKHKADFKNDYQAMIDTFKTGSHSVVFVCLPLPAFNNSWTINNSVIQGEILPIIVQIAHENEISVIDLYHPFEDKKDLLPDSIHPNAHGAALMAGIIARHLLTNQYKIMEAKMNKK